MRPVFRIVPVLAWPLTVLVTPGRLRSWGPLTLMTLSRNVIIIIIINFNNFFLFFHCLYLGVSVHLSVSQNQGAWPQRHRQSPAAEEARSDEYLKCSILDINYESVYFSVYLCKSVPQSRFYISSLCVAHHWVSCSELIWKRSP